METFHGIIVALPLASRAGRGEIDRPVEFLGNGQLRTGAAMLGVMAGTSSVDGAGGVVESDLASGVS
jgi:hypothetical protein